MTVFCCRGTRSAGLVAVLALDAGRTVTSHRLIDALWGDSGSQRPERAAGHRVEAAPSARSRRRAQRISTQPAGYRLEIDRDAVDALRFESLVEPGTGDRMIPEAVTKLLERGLALWRGAAARSVFPKPSVAHALQSRLEELRKAALDDMIDAELQLRPTSSSRSRAGGNGRRRPAARAPVGSAHPRALWVGHGRPTRFGRSNEPERC